MNANPNGERLRNLYQAFNRRDIETLLTHLHPDVEWPNAWEGGTITGRDSVRSYWLRQWAELHPTITPSELTTEPDGRLAVEVHQVVRDLDGAVLVDASVVHVYSSRDGLFDKMEIRNTPTVPQALG